MPVRETTKRRRHGYLQDNRRYGFVSQRLGMNFWGGAAPDAARGLSRGRGVLDFYCVWGSIPDRRGESPTCKGSEKAGIGTNEGGAIVSGLFAHGPGGGKLPTSRMSRGSRDSQT